MKTTAFKFKEFKLRQSNFNFAYVHIMMTFIAPL